MGDRDSLISPGYITGGDILSGACYERSGRRNTSSCVISTRIPSGVSQHTLGRIGGKTQDMDNRAGTPSHREDIGMAAPDVRIESATIE